MNCNPIATRTATSLFCGRSHHRGDSPSRRGIGTFYQVAVSVQGHARLVVTQPQPVPGFLDRPLDAQRGALSKRRRPKRRLAHFLLSSPGSLVMLLGTRWADREHLRKFITASAERRG